jgi:hypothetical protein
MSFNYVLFAFPEANVCITKRKGSFFQKKISGARFEPQTLDSSLLFPATNHEAVRSLSSGGSGRRAASGQPEQGPML